jgi:O-antigen/teichoic acid export membrane protein
VSAKDAVGTAGVVRDKATSGLLALAGRQVATIVVTIPAGIALARILAPSDFGLYAIANFLVMVVNQSLSLGFGSWLIRKEEEPTRVELNTIYTVQLLLYGSAVLGFWFLAPSLMSMYGRHDVGAVALLRALAISILLIGLRAVPATLLERALEYRRLAWVELSATLTFQTIAVGLALAAFGVWSLVIALLASSALTTIQMTWRAAWRPGLGLDVGVLRRALAFGTPWQLHQWITIAKDNIVPTLVAARFGPAAVGYLNLAAGTVYRPLFIMPILQRVTFAMYARLQKDQHRLSIAVEYALFVAVFVVVPPALLVAALAEPILTLIYGEKWLPAVPALRWFCVPAVVATVNWTAASAMFALGRPAIPMRITTAWTVCLWALTLLLTPHWGFTGVAIASACTSILGFWTAYELKRLVAVRILATIGRVLVVSGVIAAAATGVTFRVTLNLTSLLVLMGTLLGANYILIAAVEPSRVLTCLTELRRASHLSLGKSIDRVLTGLRRTERPSST